MLSAFVGILRTNFWYYDFHVKIIKLLLSVAFILNHYVVLIADSSHKEAANKHQDLGKPFVHVVAFHC